MARLLTRTTPTPAPSGTDGEDAVAGADVLKDVVIENGGGVARLVEQLDAWGFTLGSTRFSVWTLLVIVLVLVGVYLFARVGTWVSRKLIRRLSALDATQRLLSEKLVSITVWALAILVGIDLLGIDLTALTVFSGAFGLAIGFGLQKTFGNLIAGIILLMDRSIKPGDVISVADQAGLTTFGQIRKIGIRAVSVVTRDEKEYLIPNENLMINQVENWSYSSRQVRVQVPVRVSFDSDMTLAEELMMKAARSCDRVLQLPPPTAWLNAYGEFGFEYNIHCWIDDPEMGVGNVRSEVLKTLWALFQEHGIRVPVPRREISLRDAGDIEQLISAARQRAETPAPHDPGPAQA